MAIYFLNLKTFGRSGGSSAVSAAAYRSGERIRDERTGRTYDHTDRRDVMHKEIIVPSEFSAEALPWARDRSNLWNAAERAESRINARVAREYLVALPAEMSAEQQVKLARGFSHELADRYRFAVDLAVHEPRQYPGSDPRNFHAHLLATTREVGAEGLGAKTTLEWNDTRRRENGMGPAINELLHVRERWATTTNEALRNALLSVRVDHRSLKEQGIDREPYPYLPRKTFEMERQGYRTEVGEWLRRDYQARVDARMAATREIQTRSMSAEEASKEAVKNWLRYRENMLKGSGQEAARGRENSRGQENSRAEEAARGQRASRGRDDDHSL